MAMTMLRRLWKKARWRPLCSRARLWAAIRGDAGLPLACTSSEKGGLVTHSLVQEFAILVDGRAVGREFRLRGIDGFAQLSREIVKTGGRDDDHEQNKDRGDDA